jgi:hypothetical protein
VIEERLAALASANLSPTPADVAAVSQSDRGLDAIRVIAADSDFRIRLWAALNASDLLGGGARPVLVRLTGDQHADVRDAALQALVELPGTRANEVADLAEKKLQSPDPVEVVTALWTLVAAAPEAASSAARRIIEDPPTSWLIPIAEVVLALATGPDSVVIDRLKSHDHVRTKEWATALVIIHTADARTALRDAANRMPDDACRSWCSYALDVLWSMPHYVGLAGLRSASVAGPQAGPG